MNYDNYVTQSFTNLQYSSTTQNKNVNNSNSSSKYATITQKKTSKQHNSNTNLQTNRFLDSILRIFIPSSTNMSTNSSSNRMNTSTQSTPNNNNKLTKSTSSSNNKLSINKIFSKSYIKKSTKYENSRKSAHNNNNNNYKYGIYNTNSDIDTDIYISSNSTKSIYSSISSKELSWYKMEELDRYYQVLEHVMEETSANIFNVIETLQEKFIILTGGCARDNSILFTFTDNNSNNINNSERELKFENYCRIIDYLCNIPSELDKKNGFTLLIDRRNDKWSSIKHILSYIQEYFPSKINNIYILRPQSYLQRVLSTIFFQEDSLINSINLNPNKNFNLKICKTVEDLYEFIDKKQLTSEFGGSIHYRHQEWIEQRQFIERLSSTVNEAVTCIKKFIKSMEETDFPNDVNSTEILINNQLNERSELLANVLSTRRFGETVLNVIEKTSKIDKYTDKMDKYSALTPDIRIHYQTVYNLIRYLDESEETLDTFWKNHYVRLNKCLDLRKFEQSFKDIRKNLLEIFDNLNNINEEICTSLKDYENCIEKLEKLNNESQGIIKLAAEIYEQGTKLLNENQSDNNNNNNISKYYQQQQQQQQQKIDCNIEINLEIINNNNNNNDSEHMLPKLNRKTNEIINENNKSGYCIDSVEPKCYELKRYINEFNQNYEIKLNNLLKNKNLYQQIHVLKDYYLKGMELFNEQQIINMNTDKSKKYLNDISIWQSSLSELSINDEYKNMFKNLIATTTTVLFDSQQNQQQQQQQILAVKQLDSSNLLNTNTNLKLNMQEICNQLKSLIVIFNKRCEQLKKIAFPSANKPVQRVEPQQLNESSGNSISSGSINSRSSSEFIFNKSNSFSNGNLSTKRSSNGSINFDRTANGSVLKKTDSVNDEIIDEEQIRNYEKKQKLVLNELIETEKIYINELKLIIEGYLLKLYDPNNFSLIPKSILANREILFGNIQDIYQFHNKLFLKDLERVQYSVEEISKLFILHKENFYLYSKYCQNKPLSEEVWQEFGINCQFFKTIQATLGQRLPLDAYLLKPVQRISKYQLLLKELLKYCVNNKSEKQIIEQALISMIDIVNNLNDVMHSSFIFGFAELKQQGKLLKRDQLIMTKYKRNSKNLNVVNRLKLNNDSNKIIELFLYEKSLILCKRKTDDVLPSLLSNNNSTSSLSSTGTPQQTNNQVVTTSNSVHQFYYQFKEIIKTNEIGLTENIKSDKRKFEIWTDNYSYTFEANNEQEKQIWTSKIKNLLENQLNEMKLKLQIKKENSSPNGSLNSESIKYISLNGNNKASSVNQLNLLRPESDDDGIDSMDKHRLSNSSSSSSNSTITLHFDNDNGRIISF